MTFFLEASYLTTHLVAVCEEKVVLLIRPAHLHAREELSALSTPHHVKSTTLQHTFVSLTATLSLAATKDKSNPQHTRENEEEQRKGKINRFQSTSVLS